ncbi:MAG: hypothetical protein IBX55_20425 [Methyloprofundus sp.]|nr:hypothetical protein [Methyloprofundus sp.]
MLLLTRLSFMQQIQKAASSGYVYYTTGTCPAIKLPGLVKKFEKAYQVNETRQQVYRKKRKGDASAKFFVYAHPTDKTVFFWVLMVTQGQHLAHALEYLHDLRARKSRLIYGDYQLIQKPSSLGRPSFTWSLTTDAYHYYASLIRITLRSHHSGAAQDLLKHLSVMPGFSGVRQQRKDLQKVWQGEAKRHYKSLEDRKIQNAYTRQQKVEQVIYLDGFVNKMLENDLTVTQQIKKHRENLRKRTPSSISKDA